MKSAIPYFRNFPKDFKKEIVDKIIVSAQEGKNLQLVGLKGSGKSLLFRCFSSKQEIIDDFNVYQIDFNLISEKSVSAVSKLILEKTSQEESKIGIFEKKTIILADSFENINDILDDSLIRVFKAISDRYRDYVSFVFSVDRPIESGNVYWGKAIYITPLSGDDFDWFWDGLGGGQKFKNKIYNVSAGYMSIVKRLWEIASSGGDLDAVIANPRLNLHLNYQLELMKEGLRGNKNYFEVPIFETFMKGAQFGKELTALEFKAFRFLDNNNGKIVDRESLIKAVWGEYASQDVADHALDQLVHRLNNKLKNSNSSTLVETIRGRGHRVT